MRVVSDIMPSEAFTVESQPKHQGYVLVRFFENITTYTEELIGGTIYNGFQYDEYHLEMKDTGSMYEDVSVNLDTILSQAKSLEKNDPSKLPSRVNTLEDEKADKTEVDAVWEQMAAAYSEGVQTA